MNTINGARCNEHGEIYLRISDGWTDKVVDYGLSIPEAHCIAAELMVAIQKASQIATGRTEKNQPTQ